MQKTIQQNNITWPYEKNFAFTIFDDTDLTTLQNGPPIYDFLYNLGFLTTKSVWPIKGELTPHIGGATCSDSDYLQWICKLKKQGFEIALHNVTYHTSYRQQIVNGIEKFKEYIGVYPNIHANHAGCEESIYWGDARLTRVNKYLYNIMTKCENHNKFKGHVEKSDLFWGDVCKKHIKYVRNFVYKNVNTLMSCPYMPYHDEQRPYVNYWFASSEGANVHSFNRMLCEKNQEKLEEENGACIMYTHFGKDFYVDGRINTRFKNLMKRLSKRNGWFVPVSTLLDYILEKRGPKNITNYERFQLELKWLMAKIIIGKT